MNKVKYLTQLTILGGFCAFFLFGFAGNSQASTTNGTIDTTYKYAWSENSGWINFSIGNPTYEVHVTDAALTGYAWIANLGWVNMAPSLSGVINNGEGVLSGYAWAEGAGYINFTGVTIDTTGYFLGYATNDVTGDISFNCLNTASCGASDFKVRTDWRPVSVRTPPPGGGGGGGGGGYVPPTNTPFAEITINGGATSTLSPNIALNFSNYSNVTEVIISENSDFAGASYQPISSSIPFTLSSGYGQKFIYVQLRNATTTGGVTSLMIEFVSVLPPSDELAQQAARIAALPVSVHTLVKLPNDNNPNTQIDSTVYYVGGDGYRHPFPNPKVFFTWFCDFSSVQTISATQMASMQLGKNVTYRPGSVPVKFTTVSRVYVVEKNGLLRWITTAEIGAQLYGADWTTKIEDINDAFFTNYTFGADITDASQYNALSQEGGVRYPSDSMGIIGYVPLTLGTALYCPLSSNTFVEYSGCTTVGKFISTLTPTGGASTEIRDLQDLLKCLGYLAPSVSTTGIYGPLTQDAVKRFQAYHNIPVTGIVDSATRDELNVFAVEPVSTTPPAPEPVPEPTPTTFVEYSGCTSSTNFVSYLELNSVGDEVRGLQDLLRCLGYLPSTQASTGTYGSITESAVIEFQKYHNIDPLGVVGQATRAELNTY